MQSAPKSLPCNVARATFFHPRQDADGLDFMRVPWGEEPGGDGAQSTAHGSRRTDDQPSRRTAHGARSRALGHADRVLDLTLTLLEQRAWSLAARHAIPPSTYACLLLGNWEAEAAVAKMRRAWESLTLLEQAVVAPRSAAGAGHLLKDITFSRNRSFRLLNEFFERDDWKANSRDGIHFLTGMLMAMPDNKLVEDAHNVIRKDAKSNPNPMQQTARIQDLRGAQPTGGGCDGLLRQHVQQTAPRLACLPLVAESELRLREQRREKIEERIAKREDRK